MLSAALRHVISAPFFVAALAPQAGDRVMIATRLAPDAMVWTRTSACVEQALVTGALDQPGLYAVQMRFGAGCRIQPHAHPRERVVVVLSGTMLVGFGSSFDEAGLQPMPPGSVWTEPAAQAHFGWARDSDVVVHVNGLGPYGVIAPPVK